MWKKIMKKHTEQRLAKCQSCDEKHPVEPRREECSSSCPCMASENTPGGMPGSALGGAGVPGGLWC